MQASKDFLNIIRKKLEQKRILDDELINYIDIVFANKSSDVLKAIKRGIIKYTYTPSKRIIWVSVGEDSDHLVYPNLFCSCHDFYQNVVIKRERNICKHILAQLICESMNSFNEAELIDSEFKERIKELK